MVQVGTKPVCTSRSTSTSRSTEILYSCIRRCSYMLPAYHSSHAKTAPEACETPGTHPEEEPISAYSFLDDVLDEDGEQQYTGTCSGSPEWDEYEELVDDGTDQAVREMEDEDYFSPHPFGAPSSELLSGEDWEDFELDDPAGAVTSPRGRTNSIELDLGQCVQEDVIELNALRLVRSYVSSIGVLAERKTEGFRNMLQKRAESQGRKIARRMQRLEDQLKSSIDRATPTPVKNRIGEIKADLKSRVDRVEHQMKKGVQKRVDLWENKYRPRWRKMITGNEKTKIRVHLQQPRQIRLRDRMTFFLSVNTMMFAQYFVITQPEYFKQFYFLSSAVLMPIRWVMYWKLKYILFCLDFCYFVQPLNHAFWAILPTSKVLFHTCYAFAFGPISVAIILWRNSLVFHDTDKVTSVFIHIMPPLFMHCIKWSDPLYIQQDGTPQPEFALNGSSEVLTYLLWYPVCIYMLWQVLYLLVTEGLLRKWLAARPEQQTSLRWLGTDEKFVMYKLCTHFFKDTIGFLGPNEHLSDLSAKSLFIFVFSQLLFTLCTLGVPLLLHSHQIANSVWICILFMAITWNGASFYIEVFSRRYAPKAFAATPAPDGSRRGVVLGRSKSHASDDQNDDKSQSAGLECKRSQSVDDIAEKSVASATEEGEHHKAE